MLHYFRYIVVVPTTLFAFEWCLTMHSLLRYICVYANSAVPDIASILDIGQEILDSVLIDEADKARKLLAVFDSYHCRQRCNLDDT